MMVNIFKPYDVGTEFGRGSSTASTPPHGDEREMSPIGRIHQYEALQASEAHAQVVTKSFFAECGLQELEISAFRTM